MAKTICRLYGAAQIALHAKLKAKKPYNPKKVSTKKNPRRTKAEEQRLKELNGLSNRRGLAPPSTIQSRVKSGVAPQQAAQRGYGAILQDLDANGFAATRATLACAWLVKAFDLEVYTPLQVIKERVYDPQRGTTQATLVCQPPDDENAVAVEDLNYVSADQELINIFTYKATGYRVQLHYSWLLYNENSGEYNWWSIRGLTDHPQTLIGNVMEIIQNFKNESAGAATAYGKFLCKISAYCQMKTNEAFFKEKKDKARLAKLRNHTGKQKKERKDKKGKSYSKKEIKVKKKKTTNKKGK